MYHTAVKQEDFKATNSSTGMLSVIEVLQRAGYGQQPPSQSLARKKQDQATICDYNKTGEVNLMYFVFLLPQNDLLSKNKAEVQRSIFVQYKHKMTL